MTDIQANISVAVLQKGNELVVHFEEVTNRKLPGVPTYILPGDEDSTCTI